MNIKDYKNIVKICQHLIFLKKIQLSYEIYLRKMTLHH